MRVIRAYFLRKKKMSGQEYQYLEKVTNWAAAKLKQ